MKKQLLMIISLVASLSSIVSTTEAQNNQEIFFDLQSGQILEKKYTKQWNKMHIARNLLFAAGKLLSTIFCIGNFDRVYDSETKGVLAFAGAILFFGACNRLYNAYSGASSMIEYNEEVTDLEVKQKIMQMLCSSKALADTPEEVK